MERPIVVVGLPRSGTTWTLRALGHAEEALPVSEADNEDKFPVAIRGKAQVGRYPVLRPGDASPEYRRLWEWILAGAPEGHRSLHARRVLGRGAAKRIFDGSFDPLARLAGVVAGRPPSTVGLPAPQGRVVAKSIHAELSVEWLADAFDIDVVLLLRHPANVLASWAEVHLKDARNSTLERHPQIATRLLEPWGVALPGPDPVEQMSWRICLLIAVIEQVSTRHPDWPIRIHEQLCVDPVAEFKQLYGDLRLGWGPSSEEFLREHNTPGSGFVINRIASDMPDSWKRRLDDRQLETLRRVFAQFPITTWSDRDFER